MKLGIMQPYLFPYIGYFQLINAVDTFVIHDDVQYIKGGWINRNRILLNGEPRYFTLAVRNDASHLCINQRHFTSNFQKDKAAVLRQIEGAYRNALHFVETFTLIRSCFEFENDNVADFVSRTIRVICEHLRVCTRIVSSADLKKDGDLRAQERVIFINKLLGASEYINPIGGLELYDKPSFTESGLSLNFLRPRAIEYPQFDKPFVPWLSIIDVLMFNSLESTRHLLTNYTLE